MTSLSSYYDRRRLFKSASFLHCTVQQCVRFRSCNGTRMLHIEHRGWGRFSSSNITPVNRTCRCQKCTRMTVHVASRTLQPSTEKGLGPDFSRNFILNIMGLSPPSPSHLLSFFPAPPSCYTVLGLAVDMN